MMKKVFNIFQIFMMYIILASSMDMRAIKNLPDKKLTRFLAESEGYPILKYSVTTKDGYILKIFRIPGSPQNPRSRGKSAVYLMHGFLNSSKDWLVLGRNKSLPYLLADAGFDVFLGNARGNTYSRKHVKLNPDKNKFWHFSWHEIGEYDLPATVDFILTLTNQKTLHYIGFSQGTTTFFVAASLNPDFNDKIRTMHALAPVGYFKGMKSPLIRGIARVYNRIDLSFRIADKYEILKHTKLSSSILATACKKGSIFQEICVNLMFLTCGYDSELLNRTLLPLILKDSPAGASYLQLAHFAQCKTTGKFARFHHGFVNNFYKYGSIFPPEYNMQAITAPVYLHYSSNDWMADSADVQEMSENLGNVADVFRIPHPKFNHLDYIYGIDTEKLVYKNLLNVIIRDDKHFTKT